MVHLVHSVLDLFNFGLFFYLLTMKYFAVGIGDEKWREREKPAAAWAAKAAIDVGRTQDWSNSWYDHAAMSFLLFALNS